MDKPDLISGKQYIDFSTIHKPLLSLTEYMCQKIHRELPQRLNAPPYVCADILVLFRKAAATKDLIHYLHVDDRRNDDPYWKKSYTYAVAPLVRTIIDCFYNITLILEDPAKNGLTFRRAGFNKVMLSINQDEVRYGGRPNWDDYLKRKRKEMLEVMQESGIDPTTLTKHDSWPTLGVYLRPDKKTPLTPHQEFLKTFTYGTWSEYSAMSHGGFEGLIEAAPTFLSDLISQEGRKVLDDNYQIDMSFHLLRAATLILCILTELQVVFRFPEAEADTRVQSLWQAMMGVFETEELYAGRYEKLMRDSGMKLAIIFSEGPGSDGAGPC